MEDTCYIVEIRSREKLPFRLRLKLRWKGFSYFPTGDHSGRWVLETNSKRVCERWNKFCEGIYSCRIYQKGNHERGVFYRKTFFENYPPFSRNRYRCVYCGKKKKREKITIDHLVPVYKAQTSVQWQKYLDRHCDGNVNDIRNLVPACRRCNRRKGTKTGKWLIKGRIGRHESYWFIKHCFTILLLIGSGYLFYKYVYGSPLWNTMLSYEEVLPYLR